MLAGKIVGGNAKFSIMAGFNLVDLRLYISHAHSFRLGTHTCKMENEADVAEFVLDSVVRGYHVYQTIWEVQQVKVVGHVLRLFSSTCMVFLKRTGAILCRVIGSRPYTKVTKQRHLHMVLDETLAWYVRQKFGGYKFGLFSNCQYFSLPMFPAIQ